MASWRERPIFSRSKKMAMIIITHRVPRGQWRNKTLTLYFPFICTTLKKKRTVQMFPNVCYCCCSTSSPKRCMNKMAAQQKTSANLVRSFPIKLVTIEYYSNRIESGREEQRKRKGFCFKIACTKRLSHYWRIRQNSKVAEYMTRSHVKNCLTFSSTSLLGKHFVIECTW